MRLRQLGNSGLFVSELCFGAMTFGGKDGLWGQVGKLDQSQANSLIHTALDSGINFFDTANVYADGQSEVILGNAFKHAGVRREDIIVATKVASQMGKGANNVGTSRRHIINESKASLKRLGLNYIDLYQIHAFDPVTPMEETLDALDTLVRSGDVRYVGLSNWAAWQIMKALGVSRAKNYQDIISVQAYYTLVGRDIEREIIPMLTSEKSGLLVWSPLAGGYLTGKYSQGNTSGRLSELDFPPIDKARGEPLLKTISSVAQKHNANPSQISISWLLHQPAVTSVILGAKRKDQLIENIQATNLKLDDEDLSKLHNASQLPLEYPGWLLERASERTAVQ